MTFETHLLHGAFMLLANATILLGRAAYVYFRDFDGLRRQRHVVVEAVRASLTPQPAAQLSARM